MEEDKLNKAVEQIKDIKMTSSEKERILARILESGKETQPIKSPYIIAYFSKISRKQFAYVGVFVCLILVLGGGTLKAQASLPGSALYPLKVRVVEPLRGALVFSPIKKIQYETNLATKRIIEAEVLAAKDELKESDIEKLNELLENHTKAFNNALYSLRARDSSDDDVDDDAVIGFEARMNAHARVLDIISERENLGDDDYEDAEVESKHTKISKNAREKATTAATNLRKNKERKQDVTEEKYKKRKEGVRSIIDSTTKDLEDIRSRTSSRSKKIVDHTDTVLKQARELLEEGEDKEKSGDSDDAYGKILDSESSAKEAEILLQTGLRLPDGLDI